MKKASDEFTPGKHLLHELDEMQTLLKEILANYEARLDNEISGIQETIRGIIADKDTLSQANIRECREMLAMVRGLQTKPNKGRRKDIKRIDDIIGDLQGIIERW